MRVLCLSGECEFLRQVRAVFAERIVEMVCLKEAEQFLGLVESDHWNAYFVDYDLLQREFSNPVEFVKRLGSDSRVVIVGSSSFAEWHRELQSSGAIVLHKPTTIGEIGLALRKLANGYSQEMCG